MSRTFLYRCPNTGQTVQGWSADEVTDQDDDTYQSFARVACTRVHLVIFGYLCELGNCRQQIVWESNQNVADGYVSCLFWPNFTASNLLNQVVTLGRCRAANRICRIAGNFH